MENLKHRGYALPQRCALCGCNNEDTAHLFFLCPFAKGGDILSTLQSLDKVYPESVF